MTQDDHDLIVSGLKALELVRAHLLETGAPSILLKELHFSSFLEDLEIGKATSSKIGQMVQLRFGWRKEKDCYRKITVIEKKVTQE